MYNTSEINTYESACKNEVLRRVLEQGIVDRIEDMTIRESYPTDIGFPNYTYDIDFSDDKYKTNNFNKVTDYNIDNITAIYGFRIRGNTYPVTEIKISTRKFNGNILHETCYIEHLVDREYYLLDNPVILNRYNTLVLEYYIKEKTMSRIYWLGFVGGMKGLI